MICTTETRLNSVLGQNHFETLYEFIHYQQSGHDLLRENRDHDDPCPQKTPLKATSSSTASSTDFDRVHNVLKALVHHL